MKAPIVSRKHYVQHTEFTIASASVTTNSEVIAVATVDVNAANEVVEGSVIKAIYVELWLLGKGGAAGSSFVCIIEKANNGISNPSFSAMTTLDAYVNKKNILFTSQGLLGADDTNPTPIYRGWIMIPKGKQRFGFGDNFRIQIATLGAEDVLGCGMTTYKSYS